MADRGYVTMTGQLLPEEIRKVLANEVFSYEPADSTEGWYFKITNVTNSASKDLLSAESLSTEAGVLTDAASPTAATADLVKFLFVKNTGTTNGSTVSTESVNICFDAGTGAYDQTDHLTVPAGMSWFCRLHRTPISDMHARSVLADYSGNGTANVQCMVFAIIDDVA